MKRRTFVALTAASAASMMLFNGCAKGSRSLVDSPEKRRRYLDEMLKKLCVNIGPHPVFDQERYGRAADLVKAEMGKALPYVSFDECNFTGWRLLNEPELIMNGKRMEVCAAHGSPGTPEGGISGVLQDVGTPEKRIFAITDAGFGQPRGYILTNQYGGAIPLPVYSNPVEAQIQTGHLTFDKRGQWPTCVAGGQDVAMLEEAVKSKTPVSYAVKTEFVPGMQTKSVVGTLPGKTEDEIIILAHLDTVYGSPGANDNTASMIVMLMLAHALSGATPGNTVTFIATGGEEYGKLGAQHYLEARQGQDTVKQIKACIEFDSLTWGNNFQLYSTDEALMKMALDANAASGISGVPKVFKEFSGGDCKPFHEAGVPTLYVNTRGENYMHTLKFYHTPQDLPQAVAPELVENAFLAFNIFMKTLVFA